MAILELRTPVAVETNLSRAEVIDRLTRSIEPPGFMFPLFGPLGLVGRTGAESCWFESGSFFRKANRRLTLRYFDGAKGTTLRGEFALPTLQLIPIFAILAVGTLMCLLFTIEIIKSLGGHGEPLSVWQLTPYAFMIAGFFMLKFNLWFLRGSEKELLETIQDILKGPPSSSVEPWPQEEIVIRPRPRSI